MNNIQAVKDKLNQFKIDLKLYQEQYGNKKDVPVGAIGVRINELLKILESEEE